jgi:hypothetical protein
MKVPKDKSSVREQRGGLSKLCGIVRLHHHPAQTRQHTRSAPQGGCVVYSSASCIMSMPITEMAGFSVSHQREVMPTLTPTSMTSPADCVRRLSTASSRSSQRMKLSR